MKMTRKKIGLTTALGLGLAAGVLRAIGFTYSLVLYGGAVILMAYGYLLGTKPAPESRVTKKGFQMALVVSAVLQLGGVILLLPRLTAAFDLTTAVVILLFFISAMGVVMILKEENPEAEAMLVIAPVCAMGLFLVAVYRAYVAVEAVMSVYALEMLTVAMLTVALYAVSGMRFLDRSRSPLITGSVLTALFWTTALVCSGLFGKGFAFGTAEYLLCLGGAVYAAAWFLEPPVKYVAPEKPSEEDDEGAADEAEAAPADTSDEEETPAAEPETEADLKPEAIDADDLDAILAEFKKEK